MSIALNGFITGLSLIIAIGPQNALLLRQGLKRVAVTHVIAVCLISDVFLIVGGTLGVGVIVEKAPIVLVALKWLGFFYLLYFAYTCFRDALKSHSLTVDESAPSTPDNGETLVSTSGTDNGTGGVAVAQRTMAPAKTQPDWVKPVIAALVFTWLNPAAYVDTLVMLGGIANQYGDPGRWHFTVGVLAASAVWFPLIGYGAAKLSKPLSNHRVWQGLNGVFGFVMIGIALRLLMH